MTQNEDVKSTAKTYTSWHFEVTEQAANKLANLVLIGKKRATASLYWPFFYDEEPISKVGDYSIITDWDNEAKCIIKTTKVDIVPYNEVTEEMARLEGEGDFSLAYWQKVHDGFFKGECERIGKDFSNDILVLFEEFEVVFK